MQSQAVVIVENDSTSTSSIQRRVKALKRLQLESTMNDAAFYREAHILQATKYHQLNQSVLKRRAAIINGHYEPTDEECVWTQDEGFELELDDLPVTKMSGKSVLSSLECNVYGRQL